jgi:hypothetical protein
MVVSGWRSRGLSGLVGGCGRAAGVLASTAGSLRLWDGPGRALALAGVPQSVAWSPPTSTGASDYLTVTAREADLIELQDDRGAGLADVRPRDQTFRGG